MKIKDKYIVLALKTIHREHLIVNGFGMEYGGDDNLDDLRDLLVKPKYKSYRELQDKCPCLYPNPFWNDGKHLLDTFCDLILDFAWRKDFHKLSDQQILEGFNEMKKESNKNIKIIEKILKHQEKNGI